MAADDPLIFCPSQSTGYSIATRINEHFGWPLVTPIDAIAGSFVDAFREAYTAHRPIIGICAAGIVIRALAPVIGKKTTDPAVICISPNGQNVIPLLGGHYGANRLARKIAKFLDANLAETTASDSVLGLSLEEPPADWRIENPHQVKEVTAAILANRRTTVLGHGRWLKPLLELKHVTLSPSSQNDERICIKPDGAPALTYTKPSYTLGVGCVRGCASKTLRDLVNSALAKANLSTSSIEGVYSIDLKSDEAAIHDLANALGVSAQFFPPETLELWRDRLTDPSDLVFRETGCHGVSEGAALAAASSDGELVVTKKKSQGATCAVARLGGSHSQMGTPRGLLMIVGIGPGASEWRTIEAQRMLGMADDIVGYEGYVNQLEPAMTAGRQLFKFVLGEELARCRLALEQAGQGRRVALVSSGDAGIYAMASLVFETLEKLPNEGGVSTAARRVEIRCAPGISAMQMASARAGAALGHDFCSISLSDLLTPSEDILRRVKAAAEGDFVVAFYNPASSRRRTLLTRARDILLDYRPAKTPVLIGQNLCRQGEKLSRIDLSALHANVADMMTMIIVGNSHTRSFARGDRREGADGALIYTPRGYSNKGNNMPKSAK